MARTTIVFAALFLVAGLIAALLPAQEAAWKKTAAPKNVQPLEPRPLSRDQRDQAYPIVPAGGEGAASARLSDDIGPIRAEEAQSAGEATNAPADEAAPSKAREMMSILKRQRSQLAEVAEPVAESPSEREPALLPEETATTEPSRPAIRPPQMKVPSPITAQEAQPLVPHQPRQHAAGLPSVEQPAHTAASPPSARRTMQPGKARGTPAGEAAEASAESHYPNVHVQVAGPAAINVGKAAKYVVRVSNEGTTSVEDVQVRLPLPGWVTIVGAEATAGEAQRQADGAGAPRLVWTIPTVKARGQDELHLQLVAAEGQPFDLDVEWTCRPPAAHARVSVRQPQLDLILAGPSDMLYGEEQLFTLTIKNPGTGDAAGVVASIATGAGRPKEVEVGSILAGEQVEIPVQVVANQVGELQLRASASGDGGLKADAATKVAVRRAQLAVAVEAPELKFAGAETTFTVIVTNTGNAAAEDVQVSAALPSGARYVGGVSGATVNKGSLTWKVGSIAPAAQKQFEIRCQLLVEGTNRLAAQVAGKAGLAASGEGATEVEAVSELKLVVNDPSGPSPIGQEVAYEIQVMNRGSRSARNVKILVQFADGVEPTELAGGQGKLVPGQVVCEPLPELAAGEQVTLHVKAKAGKTGAHRYRVEVTSGEEDARLVSEGTSRFFDARSGAAARTAKKPLKEMAAPKTIQR